MSSDFAHVVFSGVGQVVFLLISCVFYIALVLDKAVTRNASKENLDTKKDHLSTVSMLIFFVLYFGFSVAVATIYLNGIMFAVIALSLMILMATFRGFLGFKFDFGYKLTSGLMESHRFSFLLVAAGLYLLALWIGVAVKMSIVPTWFEWTVCSALVLPPIFVGMSRLLHQLGYTGS